MQHCNQEMDIVFDPNTWKNKGFLCKSCLYFVGAIGREHLFRPDWARELTNEEMRLASESGPWQEQKKTPN